MARIIIWSTLALFILIQFVPNKLPPTNDQNPADLIGSGLVQGDVAMLLQRACYDCHSNQTQYPWYSHVAPFSWLVAKDVREAREELNFSEWQNYDMVDKLAYLDDISIAVTEGTMPLGVYTLIHRSAILSPEEVQLIVDWTEEAMDLVLEEEEEDEEEE